MKGHISEEAVQQGRQLRENKTGNDRADKIANQGTEKHPDIKIAVDNFQDIARQSMHNPLMGMKILLERAEIEKKRRGEAFPEEPRDT